MSGHSVTVKRADEVVVGDWINRKGVAAKVVRVEVFPDGEPVKLLCLYTHNWVNPASYQEHELVEVMDK